jgi:hypothetical protein
MMKLFYIEMDVGDASPLSFFSASSAAASVFFFGDLPSFLVVFFVGLLLFSFDGEPP